MSNLSKIREILLVDKYYHDGLCPFIGIHSKCVCDQSIEPQVKISLPLWLKNINHKLDDTRINAVTFRFGTDTRDRDCAGR
jgi:hypothetical protein